MHAKKGELKGNTTSVTSLREKNGFKIIQHPIGTSHSVHVLKNQILLYMSNVSQCKPMFYCCLSKLLQHAKQSSDCDDPIPIKPVHKHFFFKAIFKYKQNNLYKKSKLGKKIF